jgi:hypothetical protein
MMGVIGVAVGAPTGCDVCADVREEYCSIWPTHPLCNTESCGFAWDEEKKQCVVVGETNDGVSTTAGPIIGGQGKYRYSMACTSPAL